LSGGFNSLAAKIGFYRIAQYIAANSKGEIIIVSKSCIEVITTPSLLLFEFLF
jgi:hypothetical protein